MDTVEFHEAGRQVMNRIIEALNKLEGTTVPAEAVVFTLLAAAAMQCDRSLHITDRAAFLRLAGETWDSHRKANG